MSWKEFVIFLTLSMAATSIMVAISFAILSSQRRHDELVQQRREKMESHKEHTDLVLGRIFGKR